MAANSKIEWTHHTFNPWRGCEHSVLADGSEHPGCAHCYAEAMSGRNPKTLGKWGADGTRVMASPAMWRQPLKWNQAAEAAGERQRVFCASLADIFEDRQGSVLDHHGNVLWHREDIGVCRAGETTPDNLRGERNATLDDLRRDLFALIDATPWLDWLLLTKRPENVRRMWPVNDLVELGPDEEPIYTHVHDCQSFCDYSCNGKLGANPQSRFYRPNVWLGTSVSDQATADELIPKLLQCRDLCPVLFLSVEPLLGAVNLRLGQTDEGQAWERHLEIDWVIVGGESGPHARPMHPDWARAIRDQCQAAGVPLFFKQWGEWAGLDVCAEPASDWTPCGVDRTHVFSDREAVFKIGKKAAGRLLDGREWNEFPDAGLGLGGGTREKSHAEAQGRREGAS